MHSGAFSTAADWSEVETESLDDLVDLGGFDPVDFDVVGTREASMRSGVFATAADWSEPETETFDDLVDLGGFDPVDFDVGGAGPCEPGELAKD